MDLYLNMNDSKDLNMLYERFKEIQRSLEKRRSVVKEFLEELKLTYSATDSFFIRSSTYVGTGSSYEGTAVSPVADYDIAMCLPFPFVVENFECEHTERLGLYKLRAKCDLDELDMEDNLKYLFDKDRYLLVGKLKNVIFLELSTALENATFKDFAVSFEPLGSSFCVKLQNSKGLIKMDIVPQIGASKKNYETTGRILPIIEEHNMKINPRMMFALHCPGVKDISEQTVARATFNFSEKDALINSDMLRFSVSIAKAVCKHYGWYWYGLRSFHIKHVALTLQEQILYVASPWVVYSMLMQEMIKMLTSGKIQSFFIEGQNIAMKNEETCKTLARKMMVYSLIKPSDILCFLGRYWRCKKVCFIEVHSEKIVQLIKLPMPHFGKDVAELWFEILEIELNNLEIFSDDEKCTYALVNLPLEMMVYFSQNFLLPKCRYRKLKNIIIFLCKSNYPHLCPTSCPKYKELLEKVHAESNRSLVDIFPLSLKTKKSRKEIKMMKKNNLTPLPIFYPCLKPNFSILKIVGNNVDRKLPIKMPYKFMKQHSKMIRKSILLEELFLSYDEESPLSIYDEESPLSIYDEIFTYYISANPSLCLSQALYEAGNFNICDYSPNYLRKKSKIKEQRSMNNYEGYERRISNIKSKKREKERLAKYNQKFNFIEY